MRISDQERREIAAKLRGSRDFARCIPKFFMPQNDLFERVLKCVRFDGGNVFDRLADLIDRPTCRNKEDGYDRSFLCGACGYEAWTYDDSGCDPKDFSFCPNCGAEVVNDD